MVDIKKRYFKAYRVSRLISRAGTLLKYAGGFIGLLFLGLIMNQMVAHDTTFLAKLAVVANCAVLGLASFLFGIFLEGQGEKMLAVLDTAVNTSPVLSLEGKIEVLKLSEAPGKAEPRTPQP